MTDDSEDKLQFDKAEFAQDAPSSAVCAYCRGPLTDTYYEVAAKAACPKCKDAVATQGTRGSGFSRFTRATLFGVAAGALGAGLWYAVRAISNLEIGLIAILVGYMVGAAVRAGSHGRGGPLYQVLAVFLTYSAIVSTYVPLILAEVMKGATASSEARRAHSAESSTPGAEDAPSPATEEGTAAEGPMTPGKAFRALALFTLFIGAFAFAAPFLGGFENIIGLLIIGFGVWEAWKINRRIAPAIAGPFRVGGASSFPAPNE
jgi:hypothetical protein